jgi:hypothetical protein
MKYSVDEQTKNLVLRDLKNPTYLETFRVKKNCTTLILQWLIVKGTVIYALQHTIICPNLTYKLLATNWCQ